MSALTSELQPRKTAVESVISLEDDEAALTQTFLAGLKSEGSLRPGDCGSDPDADPAWLDTAKLEHARRVLRRDLFGLFYSHLCGLVLTVFIVSILKPLLATRNSRTVAHLFKRYLGTLTHVRSWYDGSVWKRDDPARQSILLVRAMHKKVADASNAQKIPGTQEMTISQYDMLSTQFGFIGLAMLRPKKFGLFWSDQDVLSVIHFWRYVGYLLGIEDKYNLCARSPEHVKLLCAAILEHEMKFSLNTGVEEAHEMSRGIVESIRSYIPLIDWDSFYKYLLEVMGEDISQHQIGFRSNFVYHCMRFTLQFVLRVTIFATLLNWLLRRALARTEGKKNRIIKELSEKYTLCLGESLGTPINSSLLRGKCTALSV